MIKIIFIFLCIIAILVLIITFTDQEKNIRAFVTGRRDLNLFNIDIHSSVIQEFSEMVKGKGVILKDVSISNEAGYMGKEKSDRYYIKQSNWRDIITNDKKLNSFYEKHKRELNNYDGFVVTHSPSFVLLYEKFNKPIIVINSCRYELGFDSIRSAENLDTVKGWKEFNEKLKKMYNKGMLLIVSNNKVDRDYLEMGTGIKTDIIPSLGLYTKASYRGIIDKFVLFNGEKVVFKGDTRPEKELEDGKIISRHKAFQGIYDWQDLYDYKGIIIFPYEFSTMSIFERYSANVPMFFPSKKYLKELIDTSQISFLSVYSYRYPENMKGALEGTLDGNWDFWIDRADFYDTEEMKYLQYFDSVKHLKELINTVDLRDISRKMKEHNKIRINKVYQKWENVLNDFKKRLK